MWRATLADKLREIAKSLDMEFSLDDDPHVFWIRAHGQTPEGDEVFMVRVVLDHAGQRS